MKKIVIIGANDFQNQLILKAKEMGFETHVFAWQDGSIGERTADYFYPVSIVEIDEILEKVTDKNLYEILKKSKEKHEKLGDETHAILAECGDETKEPNMLAKGMSWMKTNAKVMMDDSDATIADLIVDGCNMGIKTLCRYENQYAAADDAAMKLTDDLIRLEEKLRQDLREYL